jgi:hypothetical protein
MTNLAESLKCSTVSNFVFNNLEKKLASKIIKLNRRNWKQNVNSKILFSTEIILYHIIFFLYWHLEKFLRFHFAQTINPDPSHDQI